MDGRDLRQRRIRLYRESLSDYQAALETTIREAAPITPDNVDRIDDELCAEETRIAAELAIALHQLTPTWQADYAFMHQLGATCMSTSLANALLALGEPAFIEAPRRIHDFTAHIVEHTSAFGKPHEYRSVDDMHKYLKRHDQLDFGITQRYRVELTNSLLDVVVALHSGAARVIVQQSAHAQLAYELAILEQADLQHDPQLDDEPPAIRDFLPEQRIAIRQRDPFTPGPSDDHQLVPLGDWRRRYLWSPLKKIPSTMGRGFDALDADEALSHLARYEGMDNLGLECISGLVIPLGAHA